MSDLPPDRDELSPLFDAWANQDPEVAAAGRAIDVVALDDAPATVKREWTMAKAWLDDQLRGQEP